jgi:predicted DNA-binding protein with PD1-like motif
MKNMQIALTLILISKMTTLLATPAAVDKAHCSLVAKTTQPFILVLSSGDSLIDSITRCAKDAKLTSASLSALGQVHNPELAYFSSNPKDKPTLTQFKGYYELASLNGNITNNHGRYYTHAHAVLADKQFHGIAGHVNSTNVGLTAEITITPFIEKIDRAVLEETGFGSINTA